MKLIKGKKYVITGYKNEEEKKLNHGLGIKFPQTVEHDGSKFFSLKDKDGESYYFTWRFTVKEIKVKEPKTATIEIYKSRGQFKFRVKGANSKTLNHLYNTKQGCKKGIEALKKAMENYKIIDLTK